MATRVSPYSFSFLALFIAVSCAPIEPFESLPTVPIPEQVAQEQEAAPSGKLMTGALTFEGLGDEELNQFRVIPEEGRTAFTPRNQRYGAVDGFWWKADQGRWFKIPDHGEAWVGQPGGKPPFASDGNEKLGGAKVFWRSNPALRWASRLRGVAEPGFYPNAGRTKIGTPYPF